MKLLKKSLAALFTTLIIIILALIFYPVYVIDASTKQLRQIYKDVSAVQTAIETKIVTENPSPSTLNKMKLSEWSIWKGSRFIDETAESPIKIESSTYHYEEKGLFVGISDVTEEYPPIIEIGVTFGGDAISEISGGQMMFTRNHANQWICEVKRNGASIEHKTIPQNCVISNSL